MKQDIIDFNDGKYVFEEIKGKGKCLVPYKDPFPKVSWSDIKVGDFFATKGYSTSIFLKISNDTSTYNAVWIRSTITKVGFKCSFGTLSKDLDERDFIIIPVMNGVFADSYPV